MAVTVRSPLGRTDNGSPSQFGPDTLGHVSGLVEPTVPFRWDLLTPDNLGTLLDGVDPPKLWFIDDLVASTGKVLARSGGGDLIFVGRSLDSMFDLLGGALEDTRWSNRLHRLPLSFAVTGRRSLAGRSPVV